MKQNTRFGLRLERLSGCGLLVTIAAAADGDDDDDSDDDDDDDDVDGENDVSRALCSHSNTKHTNEFI